MGLFSAITGVIGGIQSASAASNAADERVKGLVKSADTIDRRVSEVNPLLAGAYDQAGKTVLDATEGAAGGVLNATTSAAAGVNDAATKANAYLDPYMSAGSDAAIALKEMYAPGGAGMKDFSADDIKRLDPGFDFRLEKAQQALQRSAVARTGNMGGGTLRELNREIQGVAEQGIGAAFDRFNRGKNDRFSQLATLASGGLQASGAAGSNLTRAAQVSGDYGVTGEKVAGDYRTGGATFAANAGITSAEHQAKNSLDAGLFRATAEQGVGDARAAEHLGRANAWNGALSAAGGAVDGFVSGGLDSGKGFNIRDAFRGYAR